MCVHTHTYTDIQYIIISIENSYLAYILYSQYNYKYIYILFMYRYIFYTCVIINPIDLLNKGWKIRTNGRDFDY